MIRTWNGHVGFTFCEGAWADPETSGIAELTNCLSSFVLLGVGIKGGLRSGLDDFTRLLYGALTVCGIGSVLFHAHLIEAFRFIDEMAILYLVCLGFYVAALDYFRHKKSRNPGIRYLFAVLTVTSFIGITEVDIFNGNLYLFSALTSLLVGGIFAFAVKGNLELVPTERDLVNKGRLACGVASVAWIVDMACCWEFVSYLYLHSLWHCLMAVTANCLIEIHESQTKRTDRKGSIYHTSYGPFAFVFPSIVHQV